MLLKFLYKTIYEKIIIMRINRLTILYTFTIWIFPTMKTEKDYLICVLNVSYAREQGKQGRGLNWTKYPKPYGRWGEMKTEMIRG